MTPSPRILAFAGSTRSGSFNKKLLNVAVQGARSAGAEVTLIALRDLALPLYDGDLEASQGLPKGARELKSLMIAHAGFLIAAPEYNSSISGVLKNAIDWASRPEPNEPPLVAFADKFAGLMSASPGALGGLRGLATVQSILHNIGVYVLPHQVGLPRAHEAFDPNGALKDPKMQERVEKIGRKLVEILRKM
ncbi:MAG TPA: NADPH-dependent FMN reductase [Deltaproteobacteria bacterium]|nr:NADPH-dependent FMN reductase [Deltaproteobacteria bacterium]